MSFLLIFAQNLEVNFDDSAMNNHVASAVVSTYKCENPYKKAIYINDYVPEV